MQIKTSELTDAALDWAVTKAKGYADFVRDVQRFLNMHATGHSNYSTEWAHGGPIIEREEMDLEFQGPRDWCATRIEGPAVCTANGPTPLIAAMRCYVASKLGDEVDVPDELINN